MEPMTKRILKIMSRRDYRPGHQRQLADLLHVAGPQQQAIFDQAIMVLLEHGRIVATPRGDLVLPEMPAVVSGEFLPRHHGGGIVRTESPYAEGNLVIGTNDTLGALQGDTVRARLLPPGRRGRVATGPQRGVVTKILQRSTRRTVGTLHRQGRQWYAVPDGSGGMERIMLETPPSALAQKGHKAVIELIEGALAGQWPTGRVLEDLGAAGDDLAECKSVMCRFGLPGDFDGAVHREARNLNRQFAEDLRRGRFTGREDIRNRTIITIDPVDARDFDDAISVTEHKDGSWQLGVHIADVSHFVRDGNALDTEARARTTSTYLPGHVLPMLPESLSNGICSLAPDVPRLVKSVYIDLDAKGRPGRVRPANSIMQSTARLTYEDAERVLAGDTGGVSATVLRLLKKMETLAKIIEKRRKAAGMLHLELPKGELVLKDGKVAAVRPESTSFPHTMIEMFMVEANEAVARMLDAKNVPFLRRIHPEPDGLSSAESMRSITLCGYRIPADINRKGLQELLDSVRGKPESYIINLAVLRSLSAAEYSPSPIGHYALASEHYCHFTSPIRRYPDLTVHRLVDAIITGGLKRNADIPDTGELADLGQHCSERERNSERAETDLKTYHILKLLADQNPETLSAVVTGVTGAGLWVRCPDYLIEGLVRSEDMPGSTRPPRGAANAARGASPWRIGQRITVRVLEMNLPARMCYLGLAEKTASRGQGSGSKGPANKQRGRKNPRRGGRRRT